MSEAKRKILYLLIEGLPADQRPDIEADAEILTLTESNAREALEKIFSADSVSVWADVGR